MPDLAPGQEFAGYLIESEIGRGGMGVVYRARDETLGRLVAIKVIAGDRAENEPARRRFEHEARMMAAIDDPNVIPIYGAGEEDSLLYLAMRYVEGTDLQRLVRARGRLDPARTVAIFTQVCGAVAAAHARGLVHRDIKPGNVLLSGEHAYLADFGISRLVDQQTRVTDSGNWIGTVDFMSPEQLRGEPIDYRSDIYSLGALLYCCLVGVPPLHRDSAAATITAQLNERPPRVSRVDGVPRKLDKVVGRALAKAPEDRFQSVGELAAAVSAAVGLKVAGPGGAKVVRGVGLAKVEGESGDRVVAPGGSPGATQGTAATRVESERTKGAQATAADQGTDPTRVAATMVAPASAVTRSARGRGPVRKRSCRRRLTSGVLVLIAAVLASIGGYQLVKGSGSSTPSGPLTHDEIVATVQRFATAYSDRDTQALALVLAPNVMRVDPSTTQHGKAAVLADYRDQFDAESSPERYTLRSITTQTGWAGRASATYTLSSSAANAVSGTVAFGIERVDGRAVIGLIATN